MARARAPIPIRQGWGTVMYGRLIVKKGKREGQEIVITEGKVITIGRGEESDIPLFDTGMSRRHFQMEIRAGNFIVTDLGSTNGTFVNGQRIERSALASGDVITAGASVFEMQVVAKEKDRRASSTAIMAWPDGGPPMQYESMQGVNLEESSFLNVPEDKGTRVLLKQAHRSLATLYKVGNLIHAEKDLNQIFNTTMDAIMSAVDADRGFLVVQDPETGVLHAAVSRRAVGREVDLSANMSHTVIEEAVIRGHSVISSDAMRDMRFKEGDSVICQHIRSVLCVPLEAKETILGAIYLDCVERPNAFSRADLELLTAIARQAGVAIERARLIRDLENLFIDTVRTIVSALDAKDKYTAGHSERVCQFSLILGRRLGLPVRELEVVKMSALLHDIGKIARPERIPTLPGKLSAEEFEIMKAHPTLGAEMIRNIRKMDRVVAGIRGHHENWDGTGYPDKLRGEDIPLAARIIRVADSYDAMTSNRAYRKQLPIEKVKSEFEKGSGTQFDPAVVLVFTEALEKGELCGIEIPNPQYVDLFIDEAGPRRTMAATCQFIAPDSPPSPAEDAAAPV